VHILYAANHGGRRAIEMFSIDARGARPVARWVGCAPMPAHTLPNAVVPARRDGFYVSSFYDPDDKDAWARMARGEATGKVLRWRPGQGFTPLPGGALSGANGLETSADGRWLYVSAWSARKLVALPLTGGARREIPLDFMPDNIHRAADGTLLVAGQRTEVQAIAHCGGGPCAQPWVVARIDPAKGVVTPLITRPGSAAINYAAGAIEAGASLYVTARGDGRVLHAPLARLPSLR